MVRYQDELSIGMKLTYLALSHDLDTARFLQRALPDVQAEYVKCILSRQVANFGQNLSGSMAVNKGR
jgi:hypothetical protein